MKLITLLAIAFLAFSFKATERSPADRINTSISIQNDKDFLLEYFQKTSDNLQKNLDGLTTVQLQYKPSPEQWSVSQCVEHIVLTEKMLFDRAKASLAKPANPERKEEVNVTDQQLIDGMVDRSAKASAPESLQPDGKYTDAVAAMEEFSAQRAEIIAFIKNVDIEELRNHVNDSYAGAIDTYHSFLYIAGHTARHTLQIEEVKANTGFPAK